MLGLLIDGLPQIVGAQRSVWKTHSVAAYLYFFLLHLVVDEGSVPHTCARRAITAVKY